MTPPGSCLFPLILPLNIFYCRYRPPPLPGSSWSFLSHSAVSLPLDCLSTALHVYYLSLLLFATLSATPVLGQEQKRLVAILLSKGRSASHFFFWVAFSVFTCATTKVILKAGRFPNGQIRGENNTPEYPNRRWRDQNTDSVPA